MSRFVLDKKISIFKNQSLLQAKYKEEENFKQQLELQQKIKLEELERKKKEAEEEFIRMKLEEEQLKKQLEEEQVKSQTEQKLIKQMEQKFKLQNEQIDAIKKLNSMIVDEINYKQFKIENLLADNKVEISIRKDQINILEKQYDEALNLISQENENEYELNLNQIKKDIDFLQLEIEFLDNQQKEEVSLISNEIEFLKNQLKSEENIENLEVIEEFSQVDQIDNIQEYQIITNVNKLIKLDDLLQEIMSYNFNSDYLHKYEHNNNIIEYVSTNFLLNNHMKNSIRKNVMSHYNSIEIDTKFYKYCYDIELDEKSNEILKKINNEGIFEGHIYSTKQIENLFGEYLNFYELDNRIYFYYNQLFYDCKELVNKINNISFDQYINNIEILENNIEDDLKIMLCCFIANYERGVKLLDKISDFKNCIVCLIFNSKEIYEQFIYLKDISNTIIFLSRECGTDIIPTLQAVNFMIKNYDIEYLYKIHTKSDDNIFNDTTDYLIKKTTNELISEINYNVCNCIGNPKYLISLQKDSHNKLSYKKYSNNINMNKQFIASTIFFASINVFKSVINFIKDNDYKSYFINNMYDNNLVNYNNSPSHLLERIFGVINLNE